MKRNTIPKRRRHCLSCRIALSPNEHRNGLCWQCCGYDRIGKNVAAALRFLRECRDHG